MASRGVWRSERIEIVATTSDLRSLTEAVGGDRVAAVESRPAEHRRRGLSGEAAGCRCG